jgi:hypothetical protein
MAKKTKSPEELKDDDERTTADLAGPPVFIVPSTALRRPPVDAPECKDQRSA